MISEAQFQKELELIISNAIREDVGDGDHSSLACIPVSAQGKAKLLVKDEGIIAGVEFAKMIFHYVDKDMKVETFINDGERVKYGDVVFHVSGSSQSILKAERLVLNSMQRMSAIATKTKMFVDLLEGTKTKILDTRKTTPNFRLAEKWAVRIGGGVNHRFGLYDMILIKDNHIKAAGSVTAALEAAKKYCQQAQINKPVLVEVKNKAELKEALQFDFVSRILLDNMTPAEVVQMVVLNNHQKALEVSGGVNQNNIVAYAATGVDYISIGDITHHIESVDISLKIF